MLNYELRLADYSLRARKNRPELEVTTLSNTTVGPVALSLETTSQSVRLVELSNEYPIPGTVPWSVTAIEPRNDSVASIGRDQWPGVATQSG